MSAFDPIRAGFWRAFGEPHHEESEFLPAALEVVETPPSPIGRTMAFTIVLFLMMALAWSIIGKVDIIATATGSVLPAGMVKVVQAVDSGVVRAIDVQDGDHVRRGDLLVELDPTSIGADQLRSSQDLLHAELDVARLHVLANDGRPGEGLGAFVAPPDASPEAVAECRAALRAQVDEQTAKLAGLDEQVREKSAEFAGAKAEISQLNAVLPILEQKDEIHQALHRKGFSTTFAFLDSQQELTASRHQLDILRDKATQADAERGALARQRDTLKSEYASKVLDDLATAEQRRDELVQDVIKAKQRTNETEIRSPINGVVERLALHTVGGVVIPAQRILTVVPDSRRLTVQALLPDRDVGFVHAGQPVQVKIDTFNFTKYGLLPGTVFEVARDAVNRNSQDEPTEGGPAPPGTPASGDQATFYVVRIALQRSTMLIDGQPQQLVPGMAVTAEIRTGRRSIIDYLLSPLARRYSESLHER